MSTQTNPEVDEVWQWLAEIPDPEVPAISIVDLGIVRDVRKASEAGESVTVVTITPTYSGCPAMDMIAGQIQSTLRERGIANVRLEIRLSPPWTTGWMSAKGREKLRGYGIAPPAERSAVITFSPSPRQRESGAPMSFPPPVKALGDRATRESSVVVPCPCCSSTNTECISEFGSTSCKAQYRCRDCLEPFDYFKAI